MMTCSLCETGRLNFRCHIVSPQTPSGQILGGSGKIIFYPPNKKNCVWDISGGKLIFVGPLNIEICVWGDFQGELISVSPPNIEIGVWDDLDYSPEQSLLVRRDLT